MTDQSILRIGTRGSPLALAQAHETRDRLAAAHPALSAPGAIEIVTITTKGDQILDRTLSEVGGKGLFTKEIDDALLEGRVDIAVHSMKDVPTWLPDGMVLPCILPREDPRDAFISERYTGFADMPAGAVVGTASLRRQAQILNKFPDLKVVPLRGNVQTRLRKLAEGEVDATLLAMAGLNRLDRADAVTAPIELTDMIPAVAQGAIGITARENDSRILDWLKPLDDGTSHLRVLAERALLRVLDGSCRTPIAAYSELGVKGEMTLVGCVARPDGTGMEEVRLEAGGVDRKLAEALGEEAGQSLKSRIGPDYFAS